MAVRPKLLDLFCGAGGCAVGYHRAGFDVFGVDRKPQPRYPFPMVVADALQPPFDLREFDVVHASPPCQKFSTLAAMHKKREYPDLVGETRKLLHRLAKDWVIENVVLAKLDTPTILCGSMFNLVANCDGKFHQLRRHRAFETSIFIMVPPCSHAGRPVGVYGNGGGNAGRRCKSGVNGFTGRSSERRDAMGIDWMNRGELSEAIPPAYTEFIGRHLIERIKATS